MYIQNSSIFLPSLSEEKSGRPVPADALLAEQAEEKSSLKASLKNFSEKAVLLFESLTAQLNPEQKEEAAKALSSISKAAAFASMNGYESQNERLLVNHYFGNLSGVLSDDAIKKIILSKLNNPEIKSREFLEKFASALDLPLQKIDIRI
jgi:hypothetical protein